MKEKLTIAILALLASFMTMKAAPTSYWDQAGNVATSYTSYDEMNKTITIGSADVTTLVNIIKSENSNNN